MQRISTTRPLWVGLAMAAIGLWVSVGGARAGSTLWYNGDFDGVDAIYNEVNPSVPQRGSVYDDVIIPVGQTWTIQGVFSNDQMNFMPDTLSAYWQPRFPSRRRSFWD